MFLAGIFGDFFKDFFGGIFGNSTWCKNANDQ